VLHCTGAPFELESAINNAAPGSTIKLDGTCVGNFFIDKDLTLTGPAVLDGGDVAQDFGATLNVAGGTVVLNDLTIQHGTGMFSFGGGLWNGGQLTLNRSTVTHNSATTVGGVFNYGQLTLNRSTVSDNEAVYGGAGIFNCGGSFHEFGLCTGAPGNLTLNGSTVSGNVAGGSGGGIWNDAQANLAINSSTVSGNTGGGISNNGTATLNSSIVSGNSGGGMSNSGSATLNSSTVQGNNGAIVGGAISTGGPLTINRSTVSGNSATYGGAIFVASGSTTVANSTFSNNPSTAGFDNPPGIFVLPPEFGGSGTFTTTHSTYN
jgi:hypothetical protein